MENTALFLDEQLNQIGNKKFQSTDEFITFKKGTFNIRLDAFLYRDKNKTYYAYVYPTDEKLLIDVRVEPIKDNKDKNIGLNSSRLIRLKEKIEKGDLKLIVGENIIGQLAHIAIMGIKNNWVLILIIGISCGLGGGGIGYGVGMSHTPTYLNVTAPFVNPTPFNIPTIHP